MTWIAGLTSSAGYAAIIADVRVTLADGRQHDAIQKIHAVGGNHAIAFAGSVRLGFRTVATVRRRIGASKRAGDVVIGAVWRELLKMTAHQIFDNAAREEKKLGLDLLLGSPVDADGDRGATLYSFRSPSFEPVRMNENEIVSLGSGSTVHALTNVLTAAQAEMPTGPRHALGRWLALRMASELSDGAEHGISHHLHVVYIERGRILIDTNNHVRLDRKFGERKFIMPQVATSWRSFEKMLAPHAAAGAKG